MNCKRFGSRIGSTKARASLQRKAKKASATHHFTHQIMARLHTGSNGALSSYQAISYDFMPISSQRSLGRLLRRSAAQCHGQTNKYHVRLAANRRPAVTLQAVGLISNNKKIEISFLLPELCVFYNAPAPLCAQTPSLIEKSEMLDAL